MRRVIQEQIKKKLADELLFGALVNGGTVSVSEAGDELTMQFESLKKKEKLGA